MKLFVLRNKSLFFLTGLLVLFVLTAILAPLLAPHDPLAVDPGAFQIPPMWMEGGDSRFILGTDDLGRDLLSRLIYGARVSLGVGLSVVFLSLSVGTLLGLVAGYTGGWTDAIILRFVDMLMSLPSILLAIVVVAILGPNLKNGILAVSIVALPGVIRVVRGAVMNEKSKSYVEASYGFGANGWRISFCHILPNCLAPIIVQATLGFSDGILNVAALGFLGLGAQPPTPEWGAMLADGKGFIESASWLVTLPGFCILSVVVLFNFLGDGLRDTLDPKMRGRS